LIDATENDGRTDYEVMIDFEKFVLVRLDHLPGVPFDPSDPPPVNWLAGNGRVLFSRLNRTFVEKAFSCLTPSERRAVLHEFRSEEGMDMDATCVVYRHYLGHPTSENHNPSGRFMREMAEDIAGWDREPSPLGDLLLDYFYPTDPACRSKANAAFKRASKGCDLAEIRAAQAKSSAETIERINAFAAIDFYDLFPLESEKEGELEGER
jgi:hypothetical protein